MDVLACLAAAFAAGATLLHVATCLIALARCRPLRAPLTPFHGTPPVSIIRPVCGLDAAEEQTLRSTFDLDYPLTELLFCSATRSDSAAALVARLIAEHPGADARLLFGDDRISQNPKLNNVVKGWRAASHDWVVIADSNVDMPRDYVQRLLAAWRRDTGLVSAPPIGSRPGNVWAELECAFLNTYQARWQYAADSCGFGFAQGKSMLWRREDLDAAGGIQALAAQVAEDAAATRLVRASGRRVRLADAPFAQPLGLRSARQVWSRQVRWARLRRATFPACHGPELLTGVVPPLAAGMAAAWALDVDAAMAGGALLLVWLGAEATLAAGAGWHLTWRSPLLWLARDLALPALWLQAWLGRGFEWRGNAMHVPGAAAGWSARLRRA